MSVTRSMQYAIASAALLGACQPGAPVDESASAAEAIRAADIAWEKAFTAQDTAAVVGTVEATGSVLAPNAPIATGPEAVRALFTGFWALPSLALHWQVSGVEAARSGELGYSRGTYGMSFADPQGKTITDRGKYVTVWRRQEDGTWKVVADMFNSDLPVPGS